MKMTSNQSNVERPELDLFELVKIFWSGRLIIALFSTCFILCGALYALTKPNLYTATAVLAPVSDEDSRTSNFNLSGLAGLAGINLASTGASKKEIALEILESKQFLLDVAADPEIMVPLMAGKAWNRAARELELNSEIYNKETKVWDSSLLSDGNDQPTGRLVYNNLASLIQVSERPASGFIEMSVKFLSPQLAQIWLEKIISSLNKKIKQKHIEESERNILYLQKEIQKTHLVEMQKVLYELIEVEVRKSMLASVRDDYVFEYVDPPMIPEIKTEPKRAIIVLAFLLFGLLVSFLVVLGCHELRFNRFLLT